MRCTIRLLLIAAICVAAGCGSADERPAGTTPASAVERFLEPLRDPPGSDASGRADPPVVALWRAMCETVDPAIRPGLRFYEERPGPEGCGAAVVFAAMHTGDTGQMLPPEGIEGEVTSVRTARDHGTATVAVRYARPPPYGETPPPPREATIDVLVVERDGGWWIASPAAFNPLRAKDGGVPIAEQREEHRRLLQSARSTP